MAASRSHIIETPRLSLRPVTSADIPALVPAIGNYDVARWLGRVPYPYSRADAESFVAETAGKAGKTWFVHDRSGLVGGISVDGELGYWLRRDVWGRGYAVEAAVAAIDAHFARWRAGDLVSGHYVGNDRSRRVLEKLGFEPAGRRTMLARALGQEVESCLYRLTRSAWAARRPHLSASAVPARPVRAGGRT